MLCVLLQLYTQTKIKNKDAVALQYSYYSATLGIPQIAGFQSSRALLGCSVSLGRKVEKVM